MTGTKLTSTTTNTSKQCRGCQQWLALTAFKKDKSRKDGVRARCKTCSKLPGDGQPHNKKSAEEVADLFLQHGFIVEPCHQGVTEKAVASCVICATKTMISLHQLTHDCYKCKNCKPTKSVAEKLEEANFSHSGYESINVPFVLTCRKCLVSITTTWSAKRKNLSCANCADRKGKRIDKLRLNKEAKAAKKISVMRSRMARKGLTILEIEPNLTLRCKKGHTFTCAKPRYSCPQCRSILIPFDEVAKIFAKDGYTLLTYTSSRKPCLISCPNRTKQDMLLGGFRRGYRCRCALCLGKDINILNATAEKRGYTLTSEYTGYHSHMTFTCHSCSKSFSSSYDNFFCKGSECRYCTSSKEEKQILSFITSVYTGQVIVRDRSVINPLELDILLPNLGLAIEYCGLYWHSEQTGKKKLYHLGKLKACQAANIRLITIFEDEWRDRRSQVEGYISSIIGTNKRVYARATTISVIARAEASKFLDDNHIQGSPAAIRHAFGLTLGGELIGVMTLAGNHRQGEKYMVLNRMCFKSGTTIVGGASKLFSMAKNYSDSDIVTFADLRWTEGKVYQSLGFSADLILGADYSYTSKSMRKSKQSMKKTAEERLQNKSERELRQEAGWYRIWDCGKIRFRYKAICEGDNE